MSPVRTLRNRSRAAVARALTAPRSTAPLVLLLLALLGCSDSPTGIRAVQFAPALGIDIGTFTETSSGLFYKDNRSGQGTAARTGSFVTFFVQGWYVDGLEFQPRIALTNVRLSAGELIAGVDEALLGMMVGGERIAVVPPGLGYGQGRVLVFKLEVTSVQ
jgi:hypothetical protein